MPATIDRVVFTKGRTHSQNCTDCGYLLLALATVLLTAVEKPRPSHGSGLMRYAWFHDVGEVD